MQADDTLDNAIDPSAADRQSALARPGWALAALVGLLLAVSVAWLQQPDPLPGRLNSPTWLEWLRYPIETRPLLRLPGAPATMLAVHMDADGQRVWVVGRGGSIMHTRNGGKAWEGQLSATQADLFDVTFDDRGLNGWAVGARGTVVLTHDGGSNWRKVEVALAPIQYEGKPPAVGTLVSVFALPDAKALWVASNNGRALMSSDGGSTWQEQTGTRSPVPLAGIRFHRDGQRGWAVGQGVIRWTDDGGAHWNAAQGLPESLTRSGAAVGLEGPRFLDDGQRGWVTSHTGAVLYTEDGGKNWRLLAELTHAPEATTEVGVTPKSGDPSKAARPAATAKPPAARRAVALRGLAVHADGKRLWATAADGSIWRSADGGLNWEKDEANKTRTLLRRIVMDDSGRRGWAVGADGVILSTEDEGQTWAGRTSGANAVMLAAHGSADGRLLWVAGHAGFMLASTDAGRSWAQQETGVQDALYDVTFLSDNRRGWAVTGAGDVIATTDGGEHWSAAVDVGQERLKSIHAAPNGELLWAVGEAGALWHSSDRGEHWKFQEHEKKARYLTRVLFLDDAQRGWVLGGRGWLLGTTDRGQSWSARQVQPTGEDEPVTSALRDIHFTKDGINGWLVGDGGTILATTNGGDEWTRQNGDTRTSLLAVRFAQDGKTGWAAGEGGVMRITQDGGKHWKPAESVGSARTALMMDKTGKTGWAVGYPPALLETKNYGMKWTEHPWPWSPERYPAPWFWLALMLVGGALWQALRPVRVTAVRGAEAMGTTDAPTEDFERDRLQFGPLARGISRFLRNTRTEPPLTMAISGDWGSGKSSLMALVCADLRRYGSRPVWFNAWHHQSEEQMLAALLTGIRERGLPSLRTPDGWVFRLRLLWVRSHKHFVITLAALLAISILVGYLARVKGDPTEWTRLARALSDFLPVIDGLRKGDASKLGLTGADFGRLGGQLLALATAGFATMRALTAFGADRLSRALCRAIQRGHASAAVPTGDRHRRPRPLPARGRDERDGGGELPRLFGPLLRDLRHVHAARGGGAGAGLREDRQGTGGARCHAAVQPHQRAEGARRA